jgi:hypothetical protein
MGMSVARRAHRPPLLPKPDDFLSELLTCQGLGTAWARQVNVGQGGAFRKTKLPLTAFGGAGKFRHRYEMLLALAYSDHILTGVFHENARCGRLDGVDGHDGRCSEP